MLLNALPQFLHFRISMVANECQKLLFSILVAMDEMVAVVAEPSKISYLVILPVFIDMVDKKYIRIFYRAQNTLWMNSSSLKYPFISKCAVLPVAMFLLFKLLIMPSHTACLATKELAGVVERFGWFIDDLTATKAGHHTPVLMPLVRAWSRTVDANTALKPGWLRIKRLGTGFTRNHWHTCIISKPLR